MAPSATPTISSVPNPGIGALDLYLFFNIFPSHVALPILITTLCLARNRRNVTLLNMCITWVLVGLVSVVLLYSGHQTGPEPPKMLCVAQASLLYAVPPMVSTSVLALVFQVWNSVVWKPGENVRGVILTVLIIMPYIVFFTFAVAGSAMSSQNPAIVTRSRRFFYCSIQSKMFSDIVVLYAALLLIATTIFEIWTGVQLYRNRRIIKQAHVSEKPSDKGVNAGDVQFYVRVFVFGIYIFIGLALSFISIVAPSSPVPDLILASMGTAVFVVFGTQPALWLAWRDLFRRMRHTATQEVSHVPTLTPFPGPGDEVPQTPLSAVIRDRVALPGTAGTYRAGKTPLPPGAFRSDVVTYDEDGAQTIVVGDEKAALRAQMYTPTPTSDSADTFLDSGRTKAGLFQQKAVAGPSGRDQEFKLRPAPKRKSTAPPEYISPASEARLRQSVVYSTVRTDVRADLRHAASASSLDSAYSTPSRRDVRRDSRVPLLDVPQDVLSRPSIDSAVELDDSSIRYAHKSLPLVPTSPSA